MKKFIFAILFSLVSIATTHAQEETPNDRAMLVLDASGSMWGQIDGVNKIVIARNVIGELMENWDPNVHLGFSAYGHRLEGDCGDIETLVAPGPDTGGQIVDQVNAINPKGKTPLSAAVIAAAEELGYQQSKSTVILVSDGVENCEMDPCAVGRALEENGVDLTVHVVGFDVAEEEQAGLVCLAENTGGSFFSAADADGLTGALNQVTAEVTEYPAEAVYVIIDKSGERYQNDVTWYVYPVDENGTAASDYVFATVNDVMYLRQPPGRYLVQAGVGQSVRGEQIIEVLDGESREHEIDLRAGTFYFSSLIMDDMPVTRGDVYWYVYPYNEDGSLGYSAYSNIGHRVTAELPPGRYQIQSRHFDAHMTADIVSRAGEEENVAIDFNAGYVHFIPTLNGSPTTSDVYWYIYPLNEDGSIGSSAASNVGNGEFYFTLNAGTYQLRATHNGMESRVDFEIIPGETVDHPVPFASEN